MIKQILNSKRKWSSLILSGLGSVIGLSLLLVSLQIYFDVQYIISDDSGSIDKDYLVIKKEISDLNMIQQGLSLLSENKKLNTTNTFSVEEIEIIRKESFVDSLAVFKSCKYEVMARMGSNKGTMPPFSTLVFFESIPDEFIDASTNKWNWEIENEEVPIILPTSFVDAYNFGIAISQGTPQISKKLIENVRFKLHVKGNGKQTLYIGKVIALSDRVNSILVPEKFLNYTNEVYGANSDDQPSKLIISTKNAKDPSIAKFLAKNNYVTNKEKIKGGIIQKLIDGILYYQFFICLIIVLQSALLFVFYAQILVSRSNYEIKLLLMLGYKWQNIAKVLNIIFLKVYISIIAISMAVLFIIKNLMDSWFLNHQGIALPDNLNSYTILIGFTFILIFVLINGWNIRNKIIALAKH